MAAPAGFSDLINRKYDIMQTDASNRGALEQAQAGQINALTPSEVALKDAQAYTTRQQGSTLKPLADASIAHTLQGEIPLAQAQAGYYGAQGNLTGAEAGYYGAQTRHLDWDNEEQSLPNKYQLYNGLINKGFGLSGSTLQAPAPLSSGNTSLSVTDPVGLANARRQRQGQGYSFAAGTAYVPSRPFPSEDTRNEENRQANFALNPGQRASRDVANYNDYTSHYAAGTPSVPPKGANVRQPQPQPQPMAAPPPGVHPLAHLVAHAMQTLHAAGGATTVLPAPPPPAPGPGQTITSGSWNPADLGGNTPNPNGQNQSLRRSLGMVRAAGGATQIDPIAGQGGSWSGPTAGPTTPPAPPPVAYPLPPGTPAGPTFGKRVRAAGGATAIPAKGGAAKVPGKGPQNKDSVPATLAPGEAVLNAGAANHMGRGAIAMLNSLGAAHMAAQGAPPETPPTANGVPMRPPGRGMPPAKKPAPKAAGKPPQKVAAKAGAK